MMIDDCTCLLWGEDKKLHDRMFNTLLESLKKNKEVFVTGEIVNKNEKLSWLMQDLTPDFVVKRRPPKREKTLLVVIHASTSHFGIQEKQEIFEALGMFSSTRIITPMNIEQEMKTMTFEMNSSNPEEKQISQTEYISRLEKYSDSLKRFKDIL